MPDLTALKTKARQLAALRTVRHQASVSYKQIEKDTETMTSLLRTLNPSQNQGVTLITGENTNNLVARSPGTDYHTGIPEYRNTSNQNIRIPEYQNIRISEYQNTRIPEYQNIRIPVIRIPVIRIPEYP